MTTYLEKAKELVPDLSEKEIIDEWCPDNALTRFGFIRVSCKENGCVECWNREMPEVKNE